MRIEKLELNKIKITVFPVDLNDMNINIKSLKPDSPQLHTFLFNIMEKIKKETGFNPYSGRIVVEASPMGECVELIVTKLGGETVGVIPRKKKNVRAYIKNPKKKATVYCFDTFDDLCRCLAAVSNDIKEDSEYYRINGTHILLMAEEGFGDNPLIREFAYAADRRKLSKSFLSEHGTLVSKGEALIGMAKGIAELYNK